MTDESFLIYHVALDEDVLITHEREVPEDLIDQYVQRLEIMREEAVVAIRIQNTFEENRTLSEKATLLRYWHNEHALGPF